MRMRCSDAMRWVKAKRSLGHTLVEGGQKRWRAVPWTAVDKAPIGAVVWWYLYDTPRSKVPRYPRPQRVRMGAKRVQMGGGLEVQSSLLSVGS